MSCRPPIKTYRRASSKSPTTNNKNQSGSQSPRPANKAEERSESSDEIEENGESASEPEEQTYRSTTETDGQASQTSEPAITPNPTPPQRQKQQVQTQQTATWSLSLKLFAFVIPLLLSVLVYSKTTMNEERRCAFKELRQRAPIQSPDVWQALTVNIENLLNKRTKSPNVYLFLHSNQKSAQKLIDEIALETSKCFDGQRPIEMSLKDFETQDGDDYGYPIEQYKKKLNDGKVFLIVNLNDIPPNAARALHTICDTYSPIAPDVVIFLTLHTNLSNVDESPARLAYHTLRELWKDVPDNELDALITRVIDQVLLLQS